MERGTVVLTKFPFTDLSSSKRRPCVVVSSRQSNKGDVIVAFISSVVPSPIEPTDFLFSSSHTDFHPSGLKTDSIIKLDKLATINQSIISGELGNLSATVLDEIDKRLKIALGL